MSAIKISVGTNALGCMSHDCYTVQFNDLPCNLTDFLLEQYRGPVGPMFAKMEDGVLTVNGEHVTPDHSYRKRNIPLDYATCEVTVFISEK